MDKVLGTRPVIQEMAKKGTWITAAVEIETAVAVIVAVTLLCSFNVGG